MEEEKAPGSLIKLRSLPSGLLGSEAFGAPRKYHCWTKDNGPHFPDAETSRSQVGGQGDR